MDYMMIHATCWALVKQAHSTTYLDISVTKADKVHGAYLLKCESGCICMLMYGCVYDAYTSTLGSLLSLET